MLHHHARRSVGGAVPPTYPSPHRYSVLWWLACLGVGLLVLFFALQANGATVSGTITIPTSDAGYRPGINNTYPSKVRVAGTAIETNVVATTPYTGTFTLTGVPTGPVTLLYVETPGEDSYTMESRRLSLEVTGDVAGVSFALQHHWRFLASYPPPYSQRAAYDIWEPYWAASKLGFMMFTNRSVSPQETEVWRTTNGGTSWSRIGYWIRTAWTVLPDTTGRSMLFADSNHGVIVARYTAPVGVFRTADGGATWEIIGLPKSDDGNGVVSAHNFARIDATHWIACGSENTGTYMGVGTPHRFTIWETADAGATWTIRRSWLEGYAACTAVDADNSGRAVLFATPYAFGGGMHRELRSVAGEWSTVAGNNLITNSGYGTADVPMVGEEVWVRASTESPTGPGLFKSDDYGATFTKLNDSVPQYMDFVSSYKGFAAAGGPLYATYDGGRTWLKQSGGGGVCCHGNYVWAFDTMNAVWADGGVGDPNGFSDVLRLNEPRVASFELLEGAAVQPASVAPGDQDVPILGLRFVNNGPMPLKVLALPFVASGTGNDQLDVTAVKAWWDHDGDGVVNDGDVLLTSGVYPADDGVLTLALGTKQLMQPRVPYDVLVTYDIGGYVTHAGSFRVTVAPAAVAARSADVGTGLNVTATAPLGTLIASDPTGVTPSTLALTAMSLKTSLAAGCKSVSGSVTLSEPAPTGGIVVYLSDTIAAATTPVKVTVLAGATTKSFTIKTVAVASNQSGSVFATLGPVTLSQPLTLRPMGMYSVALSPTPVVGGNAVNGTAKLECEAGPGAVTVTLASSHPAVAHPATGSIVVPFGTTSAPFTVVTSPVTATTKPVIQATANGITKTKTLTVLPP